MERKSERCKISYVDQKMETLCFTFLSITATCTFFFFFIAKLLCTRRLPPSPMSLPIIGHLHLINKYPLHLLCLNYGPVLFLKFGFRSVLTLSSPQSIKECFTTHDQTLANRPRSITSDHFSFGYKNFGVAPYGDLWRTLRRISTVEVFCPFSVQKSSFIRNEQVLKLCSFLFRLSGDDVDLKYQFTLLAAQVMLRLVVGKRGVEGNEKRFLNEYTSTFFSSLGMNVCDYFPLLRWIGYQGIVALPKPRPEMVPILSQL